MAEKILCEILHRGVSPVGFFPKRHQNDIVDFPGQSAPLASEAALASVLRGRSRDHAAGTGSGQLADGPFDRGERQIGKLVRLLARDQFKQHDTQRIHIRGSSDRKAFDHFGTGVLRGHRSRPSPRDGDIVAPGFLAQEFGDPEVEQFHGAVGGHENVAGFEIAVDHEVAVGVLDRAAHLSKQREPRGQAESVFIAVAGDGCAVDVLQHEIGPAIIHHAPVEQSGDVAVVQPGQDLALVPEAPNGLVGIHTALDDLDRHPLSVLIIGANRFVHDSHAAVTD